MTFCRMTLLLELLPFHKLHGKSSACESTPSLPGLVWGSSAATKARNRVNRVCRSDSLYPVTYCYRLLLTLRPLPPAEMVRTATPFPMVSLLFVFTAFVISNIGHIQPQRTILAFVSGIFFILSGGANCSCLLTPVTLWLITSAWWVGCHTWRRSFTALFLVCAAGVWTGKKQHC